MSNEREPERRELTPELAALEGRLAGLSPVAPRIDRDKLMFDSGRAAALPEASGYIAEPSRLGTRFWPAATAMMTAASVLLATMLVWQRDSARVAAPAAPQVAPVAVQPSTDQAPAQSSFAWNTWQARRQPSTGYLGIRQAALTRGVNAIEPTVSAASSIHDRNDRVEPSQRRMLNELLPGTRIELMPRS